MRTNTWRPSRWSTGSPRESVSARDGAGSIASGASARASSAIPSHRCAVRASAKASSSALTSLRTSARPRRSHSVAIRDRTRCWGAKCATTRRRTSALAEGHGRNADLAERMVRDAASVSATRSRSDQPTPRAWHSARPPQRPIAHGPDRHAAALPGSIDAPPHRAHRRAGTAATVAVEQERAIRLPEHPHLRARIRRPIPPVEAGKDAQRRHAAPPTARRRAPRRARPKRSRQGWESSHLDRRA
jgi:hypothetical protein